MKVKCLRSDNGGEYDKSEFKAFYAAERIRLMKQLLVRQGRMKLLRG